MQTVLLVENLKPLVETQSCTLFTHSCINLCACGRDFARIQKAKSNANNDASEPFKIDFTILLILRPEKNRRQDATFGNTHLLLIHIRQSGPSSNLEQSMGQKPINKDRQMASKIEIVKIRQNAVFSRGVVSFFQIKENGKNVFFFGKSITNVTIKTNQMICSATVFPTTALLPGQ